MHHTHGVMAHDGHSLDGIVYGQGDPISILENELTGGSQHAMRVLSLSSRQPMAVLSSSVCWLPADGSTPLSWAATSPAGDTPEVDVLPENNLPSGLSGPSVASLLTPLTSISPVDSLRRDSAISSSRNDEIDDATGVRPDLGDLLSRAGADYFSEQHPDSSACEFVPLRPYAHLRTRGPSRQGRQAESGQPSLRRLPLVV
ncbi:hypothetical protein B0T11DRAFT_273508 [Plectosphaerella cucumerina]|uniref:Uncharacterized protein n=1 Tax=Plectosphaerella cucumerina TaxID=40658 RepID=A0A8K0TUJ1_9PEZI|nr:hypothetical protein B0T11DRAFT_273508 [Plectosphaerella cucumerina]